MNEQIEQFRDRIFPADSESLEEKIISIPPPLLITSLFLTEFCKAALLMENMNQQNAVVPRKRKHRHDERAAFQLVWGISNMA